MTVTVNVNIDGVEHERRLLCGRCKCDLEAYETDPGVEPERTWVQCPVCEIAADPEEAAQVAGVHHMTNMARDIISKPLQRMARDFRSGPVRVTYTPDNSPESPPDFVFGDP